MIKMRVKVSILREVEVDIDNPVVEELDKFYRTCVAPVKRTAEIDKMVDDAVTAVEQVVGLPFGDGTAGETIVSVCAMDGEPIIEW